MTAIDAETALDPEDIAFNAEMQAGWNESPWNASRKETTPTDTVVSPAAVASDTVVETAPAPIVKTLTLTVLEGPGTDDETIDTSTQVRSADRMTVGDYADDMRDGATFPPIDAFFDGERYWIADGWHRYEAAIEAGRETLDARIHRGGRRDAILFAVGANADHGQRRDGDAKERAVTLLLKDDEWGKWSDREIARQCKVSPTLVGKVRASLSTVDSETAERIYMTRHGTPTAMRTGKIGKAKAPEPTLVETTESDAVSTEETATEGGPTVVEAVAPIEPEPLPDPASSEIARAIDAIGGFPRKANIAYEKAVRDYGEIVLRRHANSDKNRGMLLSGIRSARELTRRLTDLVGADEAVDTPR